MEIFIPLDLFRSTPKCPVSLVLGGYSGVRRVLAVRPRLRGAKPIYSSISSKAWGFAMAHQRLLDLIITIADDIFYKKILLLGYN